MGASEFLFINSWKLEEVQGMTVPSSSKAGLAFATGNVTTVTGSTGCNRLNGSIDFKSEHRLKFGPLATTRMACLEGGSAAVESKFLDALNRATEWSGDSSQLLLKNGDTLLAKFVAQKSLSSSQAKLNGNWELEYIKGNELSFEQLYPEKKPTIIFSLPGQEESAVIKKLMVQKRVVLTEKIC